MNQCEQIHGFTLQSRRPLTELEGQLYEFRHEKTGARLVWLDREDENKTFGIAFRTLPEDDTGVFHILEHSVLCGSERYPVREPFVELMKSSLQTFLNAMTFPDKTFYPVSSRNDRDFVNLLRVYMDAVFRPLIYTRPEIFWQEGWHYEVRQGCAPVYKGVVFNEMKGALASPNALLDAELCRALFPDTCYRFISGGDPAHIPDLTYEGFLNSHRRFYHPSNAYLFLDGKVELEQVLSIVDGEYLSAFDRADGQPAFTLQRPVVSGRVTAYYEVGAGDTGKSRARLAWGRVLGDYTCREEQMAVRVLAEVLCGGSQSPLKRRILSAGLAQDVRMRVEDGILQPYAVLEVQNMDGDRVDEVEKLLQEELERLVREGLDHGQLTAALASLEFQMQERDYGSYPRGVAYGMTVLDSWLYGGDPAANLEVSGLFASLSRKLEEGWFEHLLERVFLRNSHGCQVLLLPSTTLGAEAQAAEEARLQAAQAGWSDTERGILLEGQARLDTWQASGDTPEALATLPKLTLSDVSDRPADIPTVEAALAGRPLLRHPISTGGIIYVNLYFDISDFSEADLSRASFLCRLLGELNTASHSGQALRVLRQLRLGVLTFSVEAYSSVNSPETCRTFLCVSFSALKHKAAEAAALVAEILSETCFDSPSAIRELLRQSITGMEQKVVSAGSSFAMTRVMAGCSAQGVVQECAGGLTFCQWLKALEGDFDSRASRLPAELSAFCRNIFVRNRLTASITGIDDDGALDAALSSRLPDGEQAPRSCGIHPWGRKKEGIVIPAGISFAVLGGSLLPHGGQYSGAMRVLDRVASLAWLWNAVRVQGGAYGTGLTLRDTGCACFYSYRDPSAARSLECYRQTPAYLRDFFAAQPELTGFILGAVAESDPLLLPCRQGKAADGLYLKGVTYADRCAVRRDMLSVSPRRLAELAAGLEGLCQSGGICVIGSQAQIDACAAEIDTVYSL